MDDPGGDILSPDKECVMDTIFTAIIMLFAGFFIIALLIRSFFNGNGR
jgi:hypothetical protein